MTARSRRRARRRAHRPSLRLHPVRRGLGRLHEVPPALRAPLRHGPAARSSETRRASSPRSRRTSSSRASSQASPDPHARPPHQGPAPARRASPLQRRLHAARLDLAVLSAVRLARRRRADDEGPIGRSAVGRHDPARHRAAQEAARDPARVRGEGARSRRGAGSSIRSCPTASRSPTSPRPGARTTCPGKRSRPTSSRAIRAIGRCSPAPPGTASPSSSRASRSPIPAKLTLLTPGFDRKTGEYADHGVPAPVVAQYPAREPASCRRRTTSTRCCSC